VAILYIKNIKNIKKNIFNNLCIYNNNYNNNQMSKFIKFSNRIVNTAFIKHVSIEKNPDKFILHLGTSNHQGIVLLGSGGITHQPEQIWASKKEHPESYATIEKWIDTLECVSNNKK